MKLSIFCRSRLKNFGKHFCSERNFWPHIYRSLYVSGQKTSIEFQYFAKFLLISEIFCRWKCFPTESRFAFWTRQKIVNFHEIVKGWTLFLQFGAEFIPIWFKCFWTYIRFYWSKMVQIKIKLDSNVQNYQFWASEHPPPFKWTHNQHLLKMMKKNAKNHQNWAVSTMTGKEIGKFFFS